MGDERLPRRPSDSFDGGWLRTGDTGSIDERGYIVIADRTKDMIKSGGEWISSVELEGQLVAHPDVVEAAVIAMPDPRWQERPLAIVVAEPGSNLAGRTEELGDHSPVAAEVVAARPLRLRRRPARTGVGKIDKRRFAIGTPRSTRRP